MAEITDECKYIKTCSRSIFADHYEHVCSQKSWVHCDFIKLEDVRPYQKKPREWKKEATK